MMIVFTLRYATSDALNYLFIKESDYMCFLGITQLDLGMNGISDPAIWISPFLYYLAKFRLLDCVSHTESDNFQFLACFSHRVTVGQSMSLR